MKKIGGSDDGKLEKLVMFIYAQLTQDVEKVRDWVKCNRENQKRNDLSSKLALARLAVANARNWSGFSGFVTGFGDFAGPAGFIGGVTVDMAYAAKLSVQMAQRVYCIFGHDISDDFVKLRMLQILGGDVAGKGAAVGKVAGQAGKNVFKPAILQAIRAFFAKLGLRFTVKGIVAWVPVVGSGINLVVNRKQMTSAGEHLLEDATTGVA